jgi:Asp-tRNA(Asn)/Glu-tRNA(Gln) amidotransferase A subunit family amidase
VTVGEIRAAGRAFRRAPERLVERSAEQRARLEALNPRYRAFAHPASDVQVRADRLAGELRRRRYRGPLHGVTVGIKGCVPVAGLPWTEGCASHEHRVAATDAAVVADLERAGAVVMGLTTLCELAMDAPDNPFEPMGVNPWDPTRTAGGSSTGAAVGAALGLGDLHIGTDNGGSVRKPACHCGVVGFVPSDGRLPRGGLIDRTPSLTRVGLAARGIDDIRLAAQVLAELPPPLAPWVETLLVPAALVARTADAATRELFEATMACLQRAGWSFALAEIPHWAEAAAAAGVVSLAETAACLRDADLRAAGPRVVARHAQGAALDPAAVTAARERCRAFAGGLDAALRAHRAAAVLTPTCPFAAPSIEAETLDLDGRTGSLDHHRDIYVRAANAAGATAITLPAGLYPDAGVPFGVHLMAPAGADTALLDVAAGVERALGREGLAPPAIAASGGAASGGAA